MITITEVVTRAEVGVVVVGVVVVCWPCVVVVGVSAVVVASVVVGVVEGAAEETIEVSKVEVVGSSVLVTAVGLLLAIELVLVGVASEDADKDVDVTDGACVEDVAGTSAKEVALVELDIVNCLNTSFGCLGAMSAR